MAIAKRPNKYLKGGARKAEQKVRSEIPTTIAEERKPAFDLLNEMRAKSNLDKRSIRFRGRNCLLTSNLCRNSSANESLICRRFLRILTLSAVIPRSRKVLLI